MHSSTSRLARAAATLSPFLVFPFLLGLLFCLATSAAAQERKTLDEKTLGEIRRFLGHTDMVRSVNFCADGKRIVSAGNDKIIRVWDVDTGREIQQCIGHGSWIYSVLFRPDDCRRILSGSCDATMRLWDTETGKELIRFPHPVDTVRTVAYGSEGSGSRRIFVPRGGRLYAYNVDVPPYAVMCVDFSPDGRQALSACAVRLGRLWNLDEIEPTIPAEKGVVKPAILTPGTSSRPPVGKIKQVEVITDRGPELGIDREIRRYVGHTNIARAIGFSHDGSRAITGSYDQSVRLWDAGTGRELRRFPGHAGIVYSVAFSPGAQQALSASADGTVRLWDMELGTELRRLNGHRGTVYSVAYSPDGLQAVTGGADHSVRVWDLVSGKELNRFDGHTGAVRAAVFSPDGKRILSGGADRTVRLWSLGVPD
jgi:WD40 repeat protein